MTLFRRLLMKWHLFLYRWRTAPLVSLTHWRSGATPTLFIHPWGDYRIVLGGWAGNTFPCFHVNWGNKWVVVVTIRTGGRKRNRRWVRLLETNWYIHYGWKSSPGIRIDWSSQHFLKLCWWLSERDVPFVEIDLNEAPSGDFYAEGRILFLSCSGML